jgi:perosamine synthetase
MPIPSIMEAARVRPHGGTPLGRTIPLVEPWLGADCAEAVREQVLTSFVGPGPASKEFAASLSTLVGSPYCVLTTSGTVALSVAAIALGLKPGDEILVPAYGVISTINAFAAIGLKPRLVDVDPSTGCIRAEAVSARLRASTKAVCYVNFAGRTDGELEAIAQLCTARGLPLIEDAAQAIGHRYGTKAAGSFGTVGTLSFSVPKVVTTGQGGAIFTASQQIADEASKYVDHGDLAWRQTNLNRGIGTNLRSNDVLSALGLAQLRTLEHRLARKRDVFAMLQKETDGLLYAVPGDQAPFYFIVFADDPDAAVTALRDAKVMAQRHGRALYEHPPYAQLHDIEFPGTQYWNDHAVYLPFGLALNTDDAKQIAAAVREIRTTLRRP